MIRGVVLALVLLVAGALAPTAHGAGLPAPDAPGKGQDPVGFAAALERSQAWMVDALGVTPARRSWQVGNTNDLDTCGQVGRADGVATTGCSGLSYPDRVAVRPWVFRGIDTMDPRQAVEAFYVLRHEEGHHRARPASTFDEDVTDAELLDSWASWSKAVTGRVLPPPYLGPRPGITAVRTWSVRITGKPWRSHDARWARRALWNADDPTRAAMWAQGWSA